MPASITDGRRHGPLATRIERTLLETPRRTMTRDQAVEVLAELADRAGKTPKAMLQKLRTPGLEQAEVVSLVRKGITLDERAELKRLLKGGGPKISTEARALFEAVLGGAPIAKDATLDAEVVSGRGVKGTTLPNATIEAVNVSSEAGTKSDVFVVGKSDGEGHFSARLSGDQRPKNGDAVRIRARFDDGTATDWITVQASGRDERSAALNVNRLELSMGRDGAIDLRVRDQQPSLAEPGAVVALTNLRTKKQVSFTLDAQGRLPKDASLDGKAGDHFSVAVSDGRHNRSLEQVSGFVTVAGGKRQGGLVTPPTLHADELKPRSPKLPLVTYSGPLFSNGVTVSDVQQGMLADCYFPAAVAALVNARPALLQQLFKDNGDGTFTVTFNKRDSLGRNRPVEVKVDGDLWTKADGSRPLYGRGGTDHRPETMELWFPLLEKAYAQWKGSYDTMGSGGSASDVFEELTGEPSEYWALTDRVSPDTVWKRITSAIDDHRPVAAGTHEEHGPVHYGNTGVFGDHAYSVVGYQQEGDKRFVVLRNPWGDSEPHNNGADDGIFKLPLERFMQLYSDLMTLAPK